MMSSYAGEKNFYATLGVSRFSTPNELRRAFYRLAKMYAPDKHVNEANFSDELMKRLNRAYSVLSDAALRRDYDAKASDREESETASTDKDTMAAALPKGKCNSDRVKRNLNKWKNDWNSSVKTNFVRDFHAAMINVMEGLSREQLRRPRDYGLLAFEKFQTALNASGLKYMNDDSMKPFLKQIKKFYQVKKPGADWFFRRRKQTNCDEEASETVVKDVYIYDLEEILQTPTMLKAFLDAETTRLTDTAKIIECLKAYVPMCKVKLQPGPSTIAHQPLCIGCKKTFSSQFPFSPPSRYRCKACGYAFCSNCTVKAKIVNIELNQSLHILCKNCSLEYRRMDACLWFNKACELILSEDSLRPGFCCLRAALLLQPGYDDRLIQFARCQEIRPDRSIEIALELLQLEGLHESIFVSLQQVFADNLLYKCEDTPVKDVPSLAMQYNLLAIARLCYSEIDRQTASKIDLRESFDDVEDMMLNVIEAIKEDNAIFEPMMEKLERNISMGWFSELILQLNSLTDWQRAPLLLAATRHFSKCSFHLTLSDDRLPLLNYCIGLSLLLNAKSPTEMVEGFDKLEQVFWGAWHQHDELGQSLVDALLFAVDDGHTLPHETIFLSILPNAVDSQSELAMYQFFPSESELKPPNKQLWPELSFTNRNLKPLRMFEKAIQKNLSESRKPVDAALAYWDMLDLCEHPSEYVVCLLNSSLWALQQLKLETKECEVFSVVQLILSCTKSAMSVAYQTALPPPMKYYAARLAFSVAKEAGRLSSLSIISNEAEKYLETVVFYARLCPALKPPIVLASEALLLTLAYSSCYVKYLNRLGDVDECKMAISDACRKYFLYENTVRNDAPENELQAARDSAVESLLNEHRFSTEATSQPLVNNRDRDGWVVRSEQRLLGSFNFFKREGFLRVNGVAINRITMEIRLLVSKPPLLAYFFSTPNYMINWEDVATVFSEDVANNSVSLFFSLEQPDDKLSLHPFQCFHYEPASLKRSPILSTLFNVDYLLKQFAMGVEISGKVPFLMRPMKDGLLKELPPLLAEVLKSLRDRGSHQARTSRIWIQADELAYDFQSKGDEDLFVFGDVNMTIRSHLLTPNSTGKLEDADDEDERTDDAEEQTSPEALFCKDVTNHYAELAEEFPEFERLKEIAKLNAALGILRGYRKRLSAKATCFSANSDLMGAVQRSYNEMKDQTRMDARTKLTEMRSKLDALTSNTKISVGDDVIVNHVVNQLDRVITAATRYEIHQAVLSWLRDGHEGDLVELIVRARCSTSPPPDENKISSELREHFADQLNRFDNQMNEIRQKCVRLRPSATNSDSTETTVPWVPAVCHVTKSKDKDTASSLVYGGVLLTPGFVKKDLPEYNGRSTKKLDTELSRRKTKPRTSSSSTISSKNPEPKQSRSARAETLHRMLADPFIEKHTKGWIKRETIHMEKKRSNQKHSRLNMSFPRHQLELTNQTSAEEMWAATRNELLRQQKKRVEREKENLHKDGLDRLKKKEERTNRRQKRSADEQMKMDCETNGSSLELR